MNNNSLDTGVEHGPLDRAFEALKTYGPGSGRAALLPLDHAVAQAGGDAKLRKELEDRLLAALQGCETAVAREYICSKLALVGSNACATALAALLPEPQPSTAARNALEAIPGAEAGKKLRTNLPKLTGAEQIGAINSLGARRDQASVGALAALLRHADPAVVAAAAAALGNIGTTKAAKVLRAFQPRAPAALGPKISDALLVCAEHLLADSRKADAKALYVLLAAPHLPAHVHAAAQRGLHACEG